jgi:hypothetical protein
LSGVTFEIETVANSGSAVNSVFKSAVVVSNNYPFS